jgi:hypothetical protein
MSADAEAGTRTGKGTKPERRVRLLRWVARAGWALLALPTAALVTAAEYGIAYAAFLTPEQFGSVLVGIAGVGILVSLLFLAMSELADREPFAPFEWVVALCMALVTGVLAAGVSQQTMHDRGRVEHAVVVAVLPDQGENTSGFYARLADLSGRPIPGTVPADDGLAVGDHLTVTVDPKGQVPPYRGGRPTGAGFFWEVAAGLAVLQALLLVVEGLFVAEEWLRAPRR